MVISATFPCCIASARRAVHRLRNLYPVTQIRPLSSRTDRLVVRNSIQHHRCTILEHWEGVPGPIHPLPAKDVANLSELSPNLKQIHKRQAPSLIWGQSQTYVGRKGGIPATSKTHTCLIIRGELSNVASGRRSIITRQFSICIIPMFFDRITQMALAPYETSTTSMLSPDMGRAV